MVCAEPGVLHAPCTFQWTAGSQHTIATTSPQMPSNGTQLLFSSWSDGGSISHTITASAGVTYTASFTAQFYLTTTATPTAGGSISPASGWYNNGQVVQVSATPNSGYPFTGFSGGLTGTPNPQSVTMNGPVSVMAIFGATTHSVSSTPSAPSLVWMASAAPAARACSLRSPAAIR